MAVPKVGGLMSRTGWDASLKAMGRPAWRLGRVANFRSSPRGQPSAASENLEFDCSFCGGTAGTRSEVSRADHSTDGRPEDANVFDIMHGLQGFTAERRADDEEWKALTVGSSVQECESLVTPSLGA